MESRGGVGSPASQGAIELPTIYVDADACPVKDEVYVVATRYGVPVALVANAAMYVPSGFGVEMIVVAVMIFIGQRTARKQAA